MAWWTLAAQAETLLTRGPLSLELKDQELIVTEQGQPLVHLREIQFNYETVAQWEVQSRDRTSVKLTASLPAAADFYRPVTDTGPRKVQLTIRAKDTGLHFYAAPEWGRQVTLQLKHLDDHYFGLSAPLQPDNRLSPDLTGAVIDVDVASEGAAFRENYASAFSAFFISSRGYGSFFDTFARGRYALGVNGETRIHHDTGALDWHLFVGDDGRAIHRAYFDVIGAPKYVPIWALGPVGWRDHNTGADELITDVQRLTEMRMPFTAWFVDRPYSDGQHAWSHMNFSEAFSPPEPWIQKLQKDFGLPFMTWVAPATFGDRRLPKHLDGGFSYLDLSHPETVESYTEHLHQQHAVGVVGHKIDRGDEGFPVQEPWHDETPQAQRRNRYAYLMAKVHHRALREKFGAQQVTFARTAIHRTQPYLSAIWGGDPRTTWEGLQANFANAMRSSFMGFPVWGTDVGGYQGDGFIPEDLYTRWLQAGSMTGFFEIKLDGAGGSGRDRMPWQYDEGFQARFRAILEDRMRFLPYLYSLANTSHKTGTMMQPLAYRHLDDPNTFAVFDQFYLGEAIMVAPVMHSGNQRDVYLPAGQWYDLDAPGQRIQGGQTISVKADLEKLPRYVKANSIFVTGDVYRGNDRRWQSGNGHLVLHVFPSTGPASQHFDYIEAASPAAPKRVQLTSSEQHIEIRAPIITALQKVEVVLDQAPKKVDLNGVAVQPQYDPKNRLLQVKVTPGEAVDIRIKR